MPVQFIRNIYKDTILGLWKITEDIDISLSQIDLSKNELNRFNSFANETRKKHWLAYRILINKLINNNQHNKIEYDKYGKPYLKDLNYKISVTHTDYYAAAIISKTKKVGIDIEKISPRILKVKHKFLMNEELKFIEKKQNLEHLYIYWCSKEAMYKLYGKRNLDFRKNLYVKNFAISQNGKTKGIIKNDTTEKSVELNFEFFDKHVLVYSID